MNNYPLLMTASIDPKGMSNIPNPNIAVREKQYCDTLYFYLASGWIKEIVFVDNSGYDLTKLRNIALKFPGTTVEFTWHRGDNPMTATATPIAAKDWFDSQRGWNLEPRMFVQKARGLSEAMQWGTQETADATLLVYRSLHSVGTKQISVRNFGGPWTIIRVALMQARQGMGNLLIFLTLLSANLAVINFLPIPVLDGGHMVLLIYEGIRGKPADERVQEILTWIGLIFILTLMVFVFGLDFGWIARPGAH